MTTPPCTRYNPRLFDSAEGHSIARNICASCPLVMECLQRALDIAGEFHDGNRRGPDGTWAGLLWKDGQIVVETHIAEVAA